MTDIPLEVRAQRAAKRLNKKIASSHPLLAAQLAVSVESQVERLTRQDAANLVYSQRLEAGNERAWERANFRKEVARRLLPAEVFADFENRAERIFGHQKREYSGHQYADWWWCALTRHEVPWCWENCPNAAFHTETWYRREGRCPTCRKPLDPPEPEPKSPEQIQLF